MEEDLCPRKYSLAHPRIWVVEDGGKEGSKQARKNSVARRRKQLLEDWKRVYLLLLTPKLQLQEFASKCLERTHGMEGRISLLQVGRWGHAYSLLLFFVFV